jgi:predicted RNase H-like nuclease (RuvC/YqgF family)
MPKINGVTSSCKYEACLGCKKIYQKPKLIQEHKDTCTNKEKHKEICKKLLVPSGGTLGASGQEEIERLKKENERLKKEIKELEKDNEELIIQATRPQEPLVF